MNNLKEDSSFSNIQNAELLSRRTKAAGEITRNGEIKSTLQIGEEIDNVMASEEELKNRRIIKIKNIINYCSIFFKRTANWPSFN